MLAVVALAFCFKLVFLKEEGNGFLRSRGGIPHAHSAPSNREGVEAPRLLNLNSQSPICLIPDSWGLHGATVPCPWSLTVDYTEEYASKSETGSPKP